MLTDNLLAFYTFNDDSLDDFFDVGPTLTGTGSYVNAAGFLAEGDAFGTFLGSGAGAYLFATNSVFDLSQGSRTFSGWLYADSWAGQPGILSNWANAGGPVQWLFWHDGTNLTFRVRDATNADHEASVAPPTIQEWHFFVLTYNSISGDLSLQVDDGTPVVANTPSVTGTVGSVEFGNRNGGSAGFNGQLDAVGAWGAVKDGADIDTLWNGGDGREPPFVSVPVAAFHGDRLLGPAPMTVQFTDDSMNVPTSWHWEFGDETSSGAQNPSHQYAANGTYTVSLLATNTAGDDTEEKIAYVTVADVEIVEKTIGSSEDYESLKELADDTQDLVLTNQAWIVTCETFDDTDGAADFSDWGIDADHYLKFSAADPHGSVGRTTDNAYRHIVDGEVNVILGSGAVVMFDGMQFKTLSNNDTLDVAGDVVLRRCVIESLGRGISGDGSSIVQVVDCVIIAYDECLLRDTTSPWDLYSSTFLSTNGTAVDLGGDNGDGCTIFNCYLVGDNTAIDNYSAAILTQVATPETKGTTELQNIPFSTETFINVTAGQENFRLAFGSALRDVGASRVGFSAPFNYTTDIEGTTRPLGESDDVGAYETAPNAPYWLLTTKAGDTMFVFAETADAALIFAQSIDLAWEKPVRIEGGSVGSFEGFVFRISVIRNLDPGRFVASRSADVFDLRYTAQADESLSDVGAALVDLLPTNASFDTETHVLTVATADDAMGSFRLLVEVFPQGVALPIPALVGTIIDQGETSDSLTVELIQPQFIPRIFRRLVGR